MKVWLFLLVFASMLSAAGFIALREAFPDTAAIGAACLFLAICAVSIVLACVADLRGGKRPD